MGKKTITDRERLDAAQEQTDSNSDILPFEMREALRKASQASAKLDKTRAPILNKTRATYHLTNHMQGYGLKPLKENELVSIYALFAWVANEQSAAEETVRSITETRFGVKDVTKLQQKDYDEVIRFLVDLRIDEMRH